MVESLFLFLILDVVLLHRCPPGYREFSFLLQPPFLSSSEERLGSFLKELPSLLPRELFSSMCCSFLPRLSWADTACTGDVFGDAYSLGATDCVSGFPPFGQLFYIGLAAPHYLLEKNI